MSVTSNSEARRAYLVSKASKKAIVERENTKAKGVAQREAAEKKEAAKAIKDSGVHKGE